MAVGPPENDGFQFISHFSTTLEISLLICMSFEGLFLLPQLHPKLLAALFLQIFIRVTLNLHH
jgi:hypothetical protein